MMSYTSTRDPDCQVILIANLLHSIASRTISGHQKLHSVLGSLGLGGIFNHTEAVY